MPRFINKPTETPTKWTTITEWQDSQPVFSEFAKRFCKEHGYYLIDPDLIRQATDIRAIASKANPQITRAELIDVILFRIDITPEIAEAIIRGNAYPNDTPYALEVPGLRDSFRAALDRWTAKLDLALWEHFMGEWDRYPAPAWTQFLNRAEKVDHDIYGLCFPNVARRAQLVVDLARVIQWAQPPVDPYAPKPSQE